MGMLANYMTVDDKTLEVLKTMSDEEILEKIEELETGGADFYGLDKLWDIAHFALTGKSASEPIEGDPLSEFIVGQYVRDGDNFIAYTDKNRLAAIVDAVEKIDFDGIRIAFTAERIKKANLYPGFAEIEGGDTGALWRETKREIDALLRFYKKAAAETAHILVSIF
jgi:hypothetical protein